MKRLSMEEARIRISELEEENKKLREENERLRARNFGGRKKHNDAWMAAYNDFVIQFEDGKTISEIVSEGTISRRTAYRYLEYYKEMKGTNDG